MPGYDVRVLSEDGNEVPKGTLGAISIKLPLPPGSLPSLWNADDRFIEAYLSTFEGFMKQETQVIKTKKVIYILCQELMM